MWATEQVDGILIVGAGYAGLHAARAASAGGAKVTVVDPVGVHGFTTRLAAVAGGTAPLGDAFAPLSAFDVAVRSGRVTGLGDGSVQLDDGTVLAADAVVVTAGARPSAPDLPGIELALPLRTPGDALRLRRRLSSAAQVTIVGGGATGVQLAGALATSRPDLIVRIVDREPKVLAAMGGRLSRYTAQRLRYRGVELHLGQELDEITTAGVRLADGRGFDGLVVWAGGFESVADTLAPELVDDEGRLRVESDLRLCGCTRTFAAGDLVAHQDRHGQPLPMAAQVAVRAGQAAGRNAARLLRGEEPEPAALSHRGWVIDLGGGRGVAEIGPMSLAGPGLDLLPPLLHHLIDLKHLLEIAGPAGLHFAPGRHRPNSNETDRLARPPLDRAPA